MPAEFFLNHSIGANFEHNIQPRKRAWPDRIRGFFGERKHLEDPYITKQLLIQARIKELGLGIKNDEGIDIELPTLDNDHSGQVIEGDDLTGATMPRRQIRIVAPGIPEVTYTPGTAHQHDTEASIE